MTQREDSLNQTGHACRGIEMTEIRLQRSDRTEGGCIGRFAEHACQRRQFDRVAERCGSAVCFDVVDRVRRHAGQRLRRCDDFHLPFNTRRGESRLPRTIVVDCGAENHRVNRIVVGDGVVESLEHDNAGAGAGPRTTGIDIERPTRAVRRKDHSLLILIAGALRKVDRHATRHRHVALTAKQRLTRNLHRDKRSRAGGLNHDTRPVQIELVRDTRREKILVVADHELIAAHRRDQFAILHQLAEHVRVEA